MSNDKTQSPVSPVITVGEGQDVAQPNWLQRKVVTPIKKHPKIATAVGLGVALVAGAAFTGRKSAQYDVLVELQPADNEVEETITVVDTSSSDE